MFDIFNRKHQVRMKSFINRIFCVGFLCLTGCLTEQAQVEPLAGWFFCFSQDPKDLGPGICNDYAVYFEGLPKEEKRRGFYDHCFEDKKGGHAVLIVVPLNGTWWNHVIFYDANNKRIKTVKYAKGGYAS